MRNKNPSCPNFLDKKDCHFKQLQGTLDAYFHKLHSQGVGRQTNHAEILTSEEEEKLWSAGVMSTNTPIGLQNATFFVVGKMFCLRGGQEHRGLQLSQLKRFEDKYVYYENTSKNRNGSFKQLRVKSKVVPLYPTPDAGERCPVSILDKYISKLPSEAKEKDIFYARPLEIIPDNPDKPWYSGVHVGKNTLHAKLKNMCKAAEISGHKTNHSLRATAATEMFRSGAPEKLIQERTRHRSLEALRCYERLDEAQHRAVSSLLSSAPQKRSMSYNEYMRSTETQHRAFNVGVPPQTMPSINLHDMFGCTINFNCLPNAPAPSHPSSLQTTTMHTETELRKELNIDM